MKKIENDEIKEYFECECGEIDHLMRMSAFVDSPKEVYFHICIANTPNVITRIVRAIRYIFGYKSKFGHYDEVILGQEEITNMRNFLDRCLKE